VPNLDVFFAVKHLCPDDLFSCSAQVLGGAAIASAPGSFMQANFGAMDAALAAIARHVPPRSAVADLHCGVGTIGGLSCTTLHNILPVALPVTRRQPPNYTWRRHHRWASLLASHRSQSVHTSSACRAGPWTGRPRSVCAPGHSAVSAHGLCPCLQHLGSESRELQAACFVTRRHDSGSRSAGLALVASGRCRSVRFVEINPQCEEPFRAAARRLASAAELTFHVAAAGSAPHDFVAGTDVVIVDPPRKGLEPGLLEALTALPAPERSPCGGSALHGGDAPATTMTKDPVECQDIGTAMGSGSERTPQPHTLIYLSCGFPALERDCAALLGSGCWRLQHCEAFLFFPGTDSIETLAVFRRQ